MVVNVTKMSNEKLLRDFCTAEGVCFTCLTHDPEFLMYLENGLCSYCDATEGEIQEAQEADVEQEESSEIDYPSESESESEIRKNCYGCQHDLLNQQGHMEPGGCLYDESMML